ncbi:MAG: alpha/beta fold hydrolase [Paludibacter sp.]|nr:alpha/beta fold hydrolase [Paludibacter sp.]
MKKLLFVFLLLQGVFLTNAQNITGDWNGVLSVQGMNLRLVFHVKQENQVFSATMDSPDQGAKDIPMSSVTYTDDTLTIEYQAVGIVYTARLIEPDKLSGEFKQGGLKLPLEMTHEAVPVPESKPKAQDPVKPYPYNSEDVTFENKQAGTTLAGTFTFPKTEGTFKTVVLITGSGPQNRDEELLGHKPFLVLSDYLTRHGIAVLRFDDRGCFKSSGNFQTATTPDFATDVEAAVAYLQTRKEVDKKKIGLIGHSEGGLIAPMVAAHNKNIGFIVLMAGPGIKGSDIILLQQELVGKANGVNQDDLEAAHAMNQHIFDMIDKNQNTDSLKNDIKKYILDEIAKHPELMKQEGTSMNMEELVDAQMKQITSPWFLYFLKYNPVPVLEKVKCPVLAINGSKDLQVPAQVNLKAIEDALTKAHNKNFVIKEMSGLNHLFQECKTGSPNEYAGIEQTISPSALTTIADWINGLK